MELEWAEEGADELAKETGACDGMARDDMVGSGQGLERVLAGEVKVWEIRQD